MAAAVTGTPHSPYNSPKSSNFDFECAFAILFVASIKKVCSHAHTKLVFLLLSCFVCYLDACNCQIGAKVLYLLAACQSEFRMWMECIRGAAWQGEKWLKVRAIWQLNFWGCVCNSKTSIAGSGIFIIKFSLSLSFFFSFFQDLKACLLFNCGMNLNLKFHRHRCEAPQRGTNPIRIQFSGLSERISGINLHYPPAARRWLLWGVTFMPLFNASYVPAHLMAPSPLLPLSCPFHFLNTPKIVVNYVVVA